MYGSDAILLLLHDVFSFTSLARAARFPCQQSNSISCSLNTMSALQVSNLMRENEDLRFEIVDAKEEVSASITTPFARMKYWS